MNFRRHPCGIEVDPNRPIERKGEAMKKQRGQFWTSAEKS
jgi:hypothetical protein